MFGTVMRAIRAGVREEKMLITTDGVRSVYADARSIRKRIGQSLVWATHFRFAKRTLIRSLNSRKESIEIGLR